MTYYQENFSDLLHKVSAQKERYILEELNELVRRDLIVVETTGPQMFRKPCGEIELKESVRLVPKEKEYIENLEAEIRLLKREIADMKLGW
jgi:hypothetical protein